MSQRPVLPYRHANPHLKQLDTASLPPVKYQILNCQGQDILVGRMKIVTPTPSGHAFILRRFDTGAISLTTMFRAAFPSANELEEKRETAWVKENYDLAGNNGSSKEANIIRLAGTWVSPEVAMELGAQYSLGNVIPAVAKASPDPSANYRRSAKSSGNTPKATPSTVSVLVPPASTSLPTPSPTAPVLPNPSKRRKESPAPFPTTSIPAPAARGLSPRRSTRMKSPVARSVPQPLTAIKSPKSPKVAKRREDVYTPGGSDETAVEEDGEGDGGAGDDVAGTELHEQDVAEQKAMIADLKAKRDAAKDADAVEVPATLKRVRQEEEENLVFEFKEPEVGERAIVTNSRVGSFRLEPQQKSFAWGVAAFAFGLSAVTFLPNLF